MTPKQKVVGATAIATALAIPAEGLRRVAYYDPPGILSVCFGSTTNVVKGKVYSLTECRQRLDADMMNAISYVNQCAPEAPEQVLAAFGDAVYNLGPTIACDTRQSTAARFLKAGQWRQACAELPKWNKGRIAGVLVPLPGLTTRRAAEQTVCESTLSESAG